MDTFLLSASILINMRLCDQSQLLYLRCIPRSTARLTQS